ncbi:MAG: PHP domain-containing protein [Clostridia bacterium]|nr:PHP domain-containing protein [Clostridia bacterium]
MLFASCHNHSTFSDGVYTPEKLVALAKELGHGGIILSDHDTVRGTYFLQKEARKQGLLSILGCEFGTVYKGVGVHLLGFDFNPYQEDMAELLKRVSAHQTIRSRLLMEWGQKRGTLPKGVTWEDVTTKWCFNDYLCNNQIFETYLEKGLLKRGDYPEFFRNNFRPTKEQSKEISRIIGYGAPETEDVIKIILKAGGVPVVAHPHNLQPYAEELIALGVMGFETIHPDLNEEDKAFFDTFCEKHNLYKMGGHDHSSVLGGYTDVMPEHDLPIDCGGVTEEDFMKIYRRKLG